MIYYHEICNNKFHELAHSGRGRIHAVAAYDWKRVLTCGCGGNLCIEYEDHFSLNCFKNEI